MSIFCYRFDISLTTDLLDFAVFRNQFLEEGFNAFRVASFILGVFYS